MRNFLFDETNSCQLLSAVRATQWGEGTRFFATASDPFTSREEGFISIFEFPDENNLLECK